MNISYLYVIGPKQNGPVKIGFSAHPEQRLKTLQTSHPDPLVIHHTVKFDSKNIRELEKIIHKEVSHKKTQGEWFNISPQDASLLLEHMFILHEDKTLSQLKALTY